MLFFTFVSDGSPLMSAGSGMVDFVVSEIAIFHSNLSSLHGCIFIIHIISNLNLTAFIILLVHKLTAVIAFLED